MAYVIRKLGTNEYVSRPGSPHSYTRKAENARRFATFAEAARERCVGNEVIEEALWQSDR